MARRIAGVGVLVARTYPEASSGRADTPERFGRLEYVSEGEDAGWDEG